METLPYLHAETDTGVRGEYINLVRNIFERLRGAISVLSRVLQRQYVENRPNTMQTSEISSKQENTKTHLPSESLMDQHMAFLHWYIKFLVSELQPTASYQRHIIALKVVTIILQSGLDDRVPQGYLTRNAQAEGKWSVNIRVFQPHLLRKLLDLSMDSFDDVREAAVLVIKMRGPVALDHVEYGSRRRLSQTSKESSVAECSRSGEAAKHFSQGDQDGCSDLMVVLSRAEKTLYGTGRADHADGLARLFEILNQASVGGTSETSSGAQSRNVWWTSTFGVINHILTALEEGLLLAKSNLRLAVASAPVHGYLAALRYHNLDTDNSVLTSVLMSISDNL